MSDGHQVGIQLFNLSMYYYCEVYLMRKKIFDPLYSLQIPIKKHWTELAKWMPAQGTTLSDDNVFLP